MMHHAAKNGAIQRPREPLGFPSGVRCTHNPREISLWRILVSYRPTPIDDIQSAACYDTIIKAEEEERGRRRKRREKKKQRESS